MSIYIGRKEIVDIYHGTTPILEVLDGRKHVWPDCTTRMRVSFNGNTTIRLRFVGSYNDSKVEWGDAMIDWGDGNKQVLKQATTSQSGRYIQHTYNTSSSTAKASKDCIITITGALPKGVDIAPVVWSTILNPRSGIREILWAWPRHTDYAPYVYFKDQVLLTTVTHKLLENFEGITSLDNAFAGCCCLNAAPAGLFAPVAGTVTSCEGIFNGCKLLTDLPSNLFKGCNKVTSFKNAFSLNYSWVYGNQSSSNPLGNTMPEGYSLITIPDELFADCSAVTTFENCFYKQTELTAIPEGLFDGCSNVASFRGCFYGCSSLTGKAPELWNKYTLRNSYYSAGCFYGCTGLDNYDDIPAAWKNAI